jgi:hypothetical protein
MSTVGEWNPGKSVVPGRDDEDDTGFGIVEKAGVHILTLIDEDKTNPGIPMGGIYGTNQNAFRNCTQFTINFQAALFWNGDVKERHFQATVEGTELENVLRLVRASKLSVMHPGKYVKSIRVRQMDFRQEED